MRLFRRKLIHDLLSLSGVQLATYVLPLATIPYLARVLGPKSFGLVGFTQAVSSYLVLVVEFGFVLSATRDVARHRDSIEKLTEIVAGVIGARILLAGVAALIACVLVTCVEPARSHPLLMAAGLFWALSQGFSMTWYFQGLERLRFVATFDIIGKVLAAAGVFIFVHSPKDDWVVLGLQGIASFIAVLVSSTMIYREISFRIPNRSLVFASIRDGASLFVFRASVSLYTVGNGFILGLLAPPASVAYYVGSEKISKGVLNLLWPISQVLYPRLSHLVHHGRSEAVRLARISLIFMGTCSCLMAVAIYFTAPYLVRIVLGPGFEPAIPVLRILALLPPTINLSMVLGIQWMLPLGLDRAYNTIVITAGVLNTGLALVLVRHYEHLGMAWAVVIAEIFVVGSAYLYLRWRGLDPISGAVNLALCAREGELANIAMVADRA